VVCTLVSNVRRLVGFENHGVCHLPFSLDPNSIPSLTTDLPIPSFCTISVFPSIPGTSYCHRHVDPRDGFTSPSPSTEVASTSEEMHTNAGPCRDRYDLPSITRCPWQGGRISVLRGHLSEHRQQFSPTGIYHPDSHLSSFQVSFERNEYGWLSSHLRLLIFSRRKVIKVITPSSTRGGIFVHKYTAT
jgi:hypothetical protein